MTDVGRWHVPSDVIERFAHDPGRLDPATGSSVEKHLVACHRCRDELNARVDRVWIEASWDRVADVVDRPRRGALEWSLDRVGVPGGTARLISSTPSLRAASFASIVVLSALAVWASRQADSLGPFLVIAPLVPLAAIAITFSPVSDPIGEAGTATATHGPRLTMIRVAAALATSLLALVVGGLVVPSLGSSAFLWLIPGLALALGSLALGTWFPIERCAAGIAVGWLIAIAGAWRFRDLDQSVSQTVLFTPSGQAALLALALLAGAVMTTRIDRYSMLEVRR
jgi:hypothetical protein